jgi:hypothetical protein
MAAMTQDFKVRRSLVLLISISVMNAEPGFRAVVTTPLTLTDFGYESRRFSTRQAVIASVRILGQ